MVNSISSSASSATSSTYKGLSGLVSGMDTEGMIDTMMKASNARLDKLYQRQQLLTWKTSGYQNITTALYDFQSKFMSSSSSSSLFNPNFFNSATYTATGSNSGAVSVSGSMSNIKDFTIYSVDQLAKTSSFNTRNPITQSYNGKQAIFTDAITEADFTSGKDYSKLEGETLKLKSGGKTYTVTLKDVALGADGTANAQNITDAMNNALEKAGLKGKVTAELSSAGKMSLKVDGSANEVSVYGISEHLSKVTGIEAEMKASPGSAISGTEVVKDSTELVGTTKLEDMKDKSFTFDLDGVKRTIKFTQQDIDDINGAAAGSKADKYVEILNNKLKSADGYGASGKVEAALVTEGGVQRVAFTAKDSSSILSVAAGDNTVTGNKGFMGLDIGAATRLLKYNTLDESNLPLSSTIKANLDSDTGSGESIVVNGTNFQVYKDKIVVGNDPDAAKNKTYDFASGVTVNDILTTINNSGAGVDAKYNSTSDSLTVTAKESGSLGRAEVSGGDLSKLLFGDSTASTARNVIVGQDAKATVSLGNGARVEVVRNNNSFTLDGINVSLNKEFTTGDPITFTAKSNVDDVVKNIKAMVDEYNKLTDTINKAYTTRQDRNNRYEPLTAEQKKTMSEDEIKTWNEKASSDVLFGDSILQGLATDIRFAMALPSNGSALSQIGITSSTDWTQNGKLTVDETKLRSALESDPEGVQKLFIADSNDTVTSSSNNAGVMTRMQAVMEQYIAPSGTRGTLINKAGHSSSPLSLSDNAMQKEMKALQTQIDSMKDKIKTEQDRYYKQFSSLEVYINNMNAQSSWLTQQFSG